MNEFLYIHVLTVFRTVVGFKIRFKWKEHLCNRKLQQRK